MFDLKKKSGIYIDKWACNFNKFVQVDSKLSGLQFLAEFSWKIFLEKEKAIPNFKRIHM